MDKILDLEQGRDAAVVIKDVELLGADAAVVVHPLSQVISLVLHHEAHGKVGPGCTAAGVVILQPLQGAVNLGCPLWQLQLCATWPFTHRRHVRDREFHI